MTFSCFRIAAILQGVYVRATQGNASASNGDVVGLLAADVAEVSACCMVEKRLCKKEQSHCFYYLYYYYIIILLYYNYIIIIIIIILLLCTRMCICFI